MRPTSGSRPFPACILYIEFFPQQRDFGIRLFEFGLKPPTAGGAATGKGEDDAGERDGVEDTRFDMRWPLFR